MLQALNVLRIPELRQRILTTFGLLLIYRLGFQIPLPGLNLAAIQQAAAKVADSQLGSLFGIMNAFTGAGIGNAVLFSLGVMPYISASIIFSLLVKVVPQLEALQKEGASGQRKINQYTRLATIPICLVQAIFVLIGVIYNPDFGLIPPGGGSPLYSIMVVVALTAGTMFIMWLGEQITEHGIGNGISIIIMCGIISSMPTAMNQTLAVAENPHQLVVTLSAMWIATVLVVVYITRGQRRIPIHQAKLMRGRKVMGGNKHYLPLRVNQAGVMPIIFAGALFIVPNVLGSLPGLGMVRDLFQQDSFLYLTLYTALIFFFSFFWVRLMFQPTEIANNLKEHGSFIPGIRPGKATADYLDFVLNRVTLAGSAFLALIAVIPNIVTANLNVLPMVGYFLGGTSILIVVGVALDLVDKLNSHLLMRNYEGFMKGGGGGWASRKKS